MPVKRKLLDLFCGAGGASKGYEMAGFKVIGVDIKPQPHYPFEFHQADAMTFPLDALSVDAIHASPPCQRYSKTNVFGKEHPDLLPAIRKRLNESGKFWIIENVVGAPMSPCFKLCGCHFGLPHLRRQRYFEVNWSGLHLTPPCIHTDACITVTGDGHTLDTHNGRGSRQSAPLKMSQEAMNIYWMDRREMSQAIPPAYTQYLGRHLMEALEDED